MNGPARAPAPLSQVWAETGRLLFTARGGKQIKQSVPSTTHGPHSLWSVVSIAKPVVVSYLLAALSLVPGGVGAR